MTESEACVSNHSDIALMEKYCLRISTRPSEEMQEFAGHILGKRADS